MFNSYFFDAEQIFSSSQDTTLDGLPSFANLKFSKKTFQNEDLMSVGCGIYFIKFKGSLIYIGKFLGTKSTAFGGDVFRARWFKHISTLTLSGSRISIGKSVLNRFFIEEPSHPLSDELKRCDQNVLAIDRGFVIPYNRLKFIALNWHLIAEGSMLDFSFGYLQLSKSHCHSYHNTKIRESINIAEKLAINYFLPICNAGKHFTPDFVNNYSNDQLFNKIATFFETSPTNNKNLMINSIRSIDDLPSEVDTFGYYEKFRESLPSDCPDDTVEAIYSSFGSDSTLQIHHTMTKDGDLRLRNLISPNIRNIFTMYWQVRKDVFACQILVSSNRITGPGILNVRDANDGIQPLTTFKLDCSIEGSIANLIDLLNDAIANARK